MYDGPSETGGGVKECRRPRNGVTIGIVPVNINRKHVVAFEVDGILFTDEDIATDAFQKILFKLKGEWEAWLAKNTE